MKPICLPRRNRPSFWFLLLETDLLLDVVILDDLVQCRSNLRVQHLEVWKILSNLRYREDFYFVQWIDRLLAWMSDASICPNSSVSATRMSPFQIPPAFNAYPMYILGKALGPNWCNLDRVFGRNRVIFDHCSKRYYWSVICHSEPPFIWFLPIRQEIWNVSQTAVTFHGIRPPFFIQAWLQQYRRCHFFHSAHCSFGNPMCFRPVWYWRTMIPRKIFTKFPKC